MRGTVGIVPPTEALIIHLARSCGIPPWQFAAECSQEWWEWLQVYHSAQSEVAKQ
jgi:hypothetical protein